MEEGTEVGVIAVETSDDAGGERLSQPKQRSISQRIYQTVATNRDAATVQSIGS